MSNIVEKPYNVTMVKTSLKYPILKLGVTATLPENIAIELMKDGYAELADPLSVPSLILPTSKLTAETKKKKQDEEEQKKTSLFIDENYMYEQIKKPSECAFLRYSFADGTISEHQIIDGSEPLYPIMDEEVVNGHICLPSGVNEYETEEKLILDIESHVKKYLDVPEDYLHYAALNILKSWVYERFNSLNYLRVQGEPGTGKSRFLDVIGGLHYKPIATSGATTVAPIFRLINKWGCTLIMDEADLASSDETNDTIKIINQGFEKGRPVLRCNPDDKTKVEFFNVYCPKVLSTRHAFDDVATETRCMTQVMTGTTRTDIIASLNEKFRAEQTILRNKLLLWRFRNYKRIDPDIGETLDWKGIEPRLKQVNTGFVSLIVHDKPYIEKFMAKIREKQADIRNERSETVEGHIVSACARCVLEDRAIVAKTIIDYAELTDQKGNKWKPRRLASYMKTLGFLGTKQIKVDGVNEKVYQYNDHVLSQLFRKYMPEDEFEMFILDCQKVAKNLKISNRVTVVTIVEEQGKTVTTLDFTPPVTIGGCPPKEGYNGYSATEADKLRLAFKRGDIAHLDPELDRLAEFD